MGMNLIVIAIVLLVAYIWAGLVIVQSFLILSFAPWFGAAAIALALLVIYALAVTDDWEAAG